FARQDSHTVILAWRADSDWTVTPLSAWAGVEARHQPADDPVLVVDGAGLPHLFGTDGRGTIVHAAPGEWVEPGTPRRSRPVRAATAPPLPTEQTRTRSDPSEAGDTEPVPEPLPL